MLVFTGWAWGGVVLWTQFATCCLGALALLVALMPQDPHSPHRSRLRRGFLISLVMGLVAAGGLGLIDWLELSKQRNATLQLIPDATLPDIAFADWGLRGAGVGAGLAVAGMFATVFGIPTSTRSSLLRFPPFWIGVALFGYIAVQSLNPWGLVVERDLTWNIVPQDHITWLPAGLAAPFIGDRDPGGMNGWRQMLILSGPWMLLCALRVSLLRERTYVTLSWLICLNALAVGFVGNLFAAARAREFLGFRPWPDRQPVFGPFVYKNHAGIYLYLAAAVALALAAHLIVSKGSRADRGGIHLLAALLFILLLGLSASTLSIGAVTVVLSLLLLSPVLYFYDMRLRAALSPLPALILLGAACIIGYAALDSGNLQKYRRRIEEKATAFERRGEDDRAPLRRAAFAQIEQGSTLRLLSGWGAGSYRWVAPPFLAQQPEFLDYKGRLRGRSNFAHCDWIQAGLEWGVLGLAFVAAGLCWLAVKLRSAVVSRSAHLCVLAVVLVALLLHAAIDFIFYFTPILTLLVFILAWLATALDKLAFQRREESGVVA